MSAHDQVRSAARVLSVLEALNVNGMADLGALQRMTGLPKSTIARLLNTLVDCGYVSQVSRAAGYAVTERVLDLSNGFKHADRVVAIARGHMDAFTAAHQWPMTLQTYDRGAMRNRYFTGNRSPLNSDPVSLKNRFPMLTTAHGQVYLAFCGDAERQLILSMLRASTSRGNAVAKDTRFVDNCLADVHRLGYALRAATPSDRVLGLAVPIRHQGGVAATVGLRYFGSAMSQAEAVSRYLHSLQDLAAAVARMLSPDAQVIPETGGHAVAGMPPAAKLRA